MILRNLSNNTKKLNNSSKFYLKSIHNRYSVNMCVFLVGKLTYLFIQHHFSFVITGGIYDGWKFAKPA